MSYAVFVDDNAHYMDQSQRRKAGEFESYHEALKAARAIVENCLQDGYRPGLSAKALYESYVREGDDPYIVASAPSPAVEPRFSAWDYAKLRCKAICSGKAL
ncbi:hypothetical protein BH11PSE11_BH11PSE11_02890 [soil metagenome]